MNSGRKPLAEWITVLLILLLTWILLPALMSGNAQNNSPGETPAKYEVISTLTDNEQKWLHDHPLIRVVQDPGWPPIEFTDENGEPSGMAADYLILIELRLGVKFERVRNLTWQEAYARLKRGEIDMTTSVAVTPERAEFWAFTRPYMKNPVVMVTSADVTYINDMHELSGKKVAVVEGYAVNDWIPRDFPEIQLVRVKTAQEGLESLQRGDVFVYIDNMLVVGYYLSKLKITNLKIAGETPYVNAQCMAVRKDWAPLAHILQKAIDSISETEHSSIYRKWLPVRYEHSFNYTLLWQVLIIFAAILLSLTLWIRKLCREIKYRKQVETELKESREKFENVFEHAPIGKSLTEIGGIIHINQAFCSLLGYSMEEMKGLKWQEITCPEDIELTQNRITSLLNGEMESARFLKRYIHKNGSLIWADVSTYLQRDRTGKPLYFITSVIDITERKQAEEALQASEVRYRRLFETARDGIIILDADTGMIIDVNPFITDLLGYTFEQFMKKTIWDIGFFKDIISSKEKFLELQENEYIRYEDLPIETSDGRKIDVEFTSYIYEINGKKVVQCSIRDITGRKHADYLQHTSEVRYRRLFEAAKDGIIILDAETGMIVDVNPFITDLLDYPHEQFMKKSIWDIGFFKDIIPNKDKFLELQKNGYVRYEYLPLETSDGREIDVEFISNIYEVAHKKVIQCNIRDITERVQMQKTLLKISMHLKTLLSAIPDIVMEVDNNKIYTWANMPGIEFFGDDVIGMQADFYFEGEQKTYQSVQPLFDGYENVIYLESWQRRKDGEKRLLAWWCRVLKDESGNVTGALSTARDITEQKKLKNERRFFTEELERSNIELQQFAYVASHDLQEPLRMISSYLQLIERRYKNRLDADADDFINFAVDGANRMQSLITGLLEFSRVRTHGRPFTEVNVKYVLDRVLKDLEMQINETETVIKYQNMPVITADETQIARLFQNLIQNSIKFRRDGIKPHIKISSEKNGDEYKFCIIDNGIGIEPQYFKRIFTIFQRLHAREEYPGTGIGLSICKRIVERHGGSIWLESEFGQGTSFYFSIPAKIVPNGFAATNGGTV